MYRWPARYLVDEDLATLTSHVRLVNTRLQEPIRILRPELSPQQRWTLSIGCSPPSGSIVEHRATLSAGRCSATAVRRTWRALPVGAGVRRRPRSALHRTRGTVPPRGGSARCCVRRCTTVPEGRIPPDHPGRHRAGGRHADIRDLPVLPGRADILTALFRRAADRLSADTA